MKNYLKPTSIWGLLLLLLFVNGISNKIVGWKSKWQQPKKDG